MSTAEDTRAFAEWINNKYQVAGHYHPLTCAACPANLEAIINADGQVVLRCPSTTHQYTQRVPQPLRFLYLKMPELPNPLAEMLK